MDLIAFFDAAWAASERALATSGAIDFDYQLGSYPIQLRFAGPALAPRLTRALAHLAAAPHPAPTLTLHAWDSASTGVAVPPPPWDWQDVEQQAAALRETGHRIQVLYFHGPGSLFLYDREQGRAVYWIRAAELVPEWESAAPFRIIFQWWGVMHGLHMLHAGAVGLPSGGVLLTGQGGSGKSNTALECFRSPLCYASDDFCLVDLTATPTVYSLYSSGKTHAVDIDRRPYMRPMVSNPDRLDTQKALYYFAEHMPDKLVPQFRILALLAPHVTDRATTTLRPAKPGEMFSNLAPSTIYLWPNATRMTFPVLARLTRQVPGYHLDLGRDQTRIPTVIYELVTSLASSLMSFHNQVR